MCSLVVCSNSQVPSRLLGARARPDAQLGIRRGSEPLFYTEQAACSTGRLCWVYFDVEEKAGRANEDG